MSVPGVRFGRESLIILSFYIAVASQKQFVYSTLTGIYEIRVLLLYPGKTDEPLIGTLQTWNMNNKPQPFVAISYHWGSRDLIKEIYVNGFKLKITASLHAALVRARATEPGAITPLWADAICVNQEDELERSQQVGYMQRIYGECKECFIYLGEEGDNSREIPAMIWKLTLAYMSLRSMAGTETTSIRIEEADYERHAIPGPQDVGWKALRRFLERPWFRRVWVIQEFVLSPQARMYCGDWSMPGHILGGLVSMNVQTTLPTYYKLDQTDEATVCLEHRKKAIELLTNHLSLKNAVSGQFDQNFSPERLGLQNRTRSVDLKKLELVNILEIYKICEATDPRDRFFAVLSLASDIKGMELEANYLKNIDETRQKWIEAIINHGRGLKMLQFVAPRRSSRDKLPSWCPNWLSYEYGQEDWQYFLINPKPEESPNSASAGLNLRISDGTDELIVEGCLIDKLRTCAERTLSDHDGVSDLICQAEIDAMAAIAKDYPTGELIEDAKWRAMAAYQELPGGAEDYQAYRESLRLKSSGFWDALSSATREAKIQAASNFSTVRNLTSHARFCITEKGYFGMVAKPAAIGDDVLVVPGFPQAFIVRQLDNSKSYKWMGAAYVHGIIAGEDTVLGSHNLAKIKIV